MIPIEIFEFDVPGQGNIELGIIDERRIGRVGDILLRLIESFIDESPDVTQLFSFVMRAQRSGGIVEAGDTGYIVRQRYTDAVGQRFSHLDLVTPVDRYFPTIRFQI